MQPEHSVANQDNDIRSDAKSEARGSSSLGLRLSGSDRTLKRASRRAGEQASKRASEQAGEHCWERSGIASGQPATPEPRTPEVAADRASPSEGALRCLSPITWEGPPHQQEELSRKSDPGFLALLVPGTKTGLRGLARRLPFDTRARAGFQGLTRRPPFSGLAPGPCGTPCCRCRGQLPAPLRPPRQRATFRMAWLRTLVASQKKGPAALPSPKFTIVRWRDLT